MNTSKYILAGRRIIMDAEEFKNQLKTIYIGLHNYVHTVLDELEEDQILWRPGESRARTIFSYFRHMVNTEIYWLYALKKHDLEYAGPKTPFKRILEQYKNVEAVYLKMLEGASTKDLDISPTRYEINPETKDIAGIEQQGTLAWTLIRVTLHALGHISQITHILYSQNITPKKSKEFSWWNSTENIISLAKLIPK